MRSDKVYEHGFFAGPCWLFIDCLMGGAALLNSVNTDVSVSPFLCVCISHLHEALT